MAMAYHARKFGKTALLIEEQKIGDPNRYWSSSFSARQNRVQYTEKYLTSYVLESNRYWDFIEEESGKEKMRLTEGALWFGDKEVTTSEGNIFESNHILEQLKVPRLYMESLIPNKPDFFLNFNFDNTIETEDGPKKIADDWAALFQHDGGSINMEKSYKYFHNFATKEDKAPTPVVVMEDEALITSYIESAVGQHEFIYTKNSKENIVKGKKVFIAVGIATPTFMNDIMNGGSHLEDESVVEEYLASYFEIESNEEEDYKKSFKQKNFPNWIQFLDEPYAMGYGFPYHKWDQPVEGKETIKIGTMSKDPINNYRSYLQEIKKGLPPVKSDDHRVKDCEDYVRTYMKNLKTNSSGNYRCPILFYNSRETLLDYANRTREDIVVQSGGWIGKYFPLLARTAFDMLFTPDKIWNASEEGKFLMNDSGVDYYHIKQFLNRTTYPIKNQVINYISSQPVVSTEVYDTAIIGAGVSGLYSAYRLNQKYPNHKIGVFDMLDRIAGRLWSIKFKGAASAM